MELTKKKMVIYSEQLSPIKNRGRKLLLFFFFIKNTIYSKGFICLVDMADDLLGEQDSTCCTLHLKQQIPLRHHPSPSLVSRWTGKGCYFPGHFVPSQSSQHLSLSLWKCYSWSHPQYYIFRKGEKCHCMALKRGLIPISRNKKENTYYMQKVK